ncbi:hypothetical protein [Sorangium sp. So ce1000]|uniref:hypothetical protein n=1 Tax=Sorangium sp. So ce1000 TaxID=3133325 RepID=UPI003F5ECA72
MSTAATLLGAQLALGPGFLLGELLFEWGPLDHVARGTWHVPRGDGRAAPRRRACSGKAAAADAPAARSATDRQLALGTGSPAGIRPS